MAELADALALGASGRKPVEVRVLFRAPEMLADVQGIGRALASYLVPGLS